jgi:multiple sugar transport system permease protein
MSGDGVVNKILDIFGIKILWFSDPKIAMASIALLAIWKHVGYFGLIFLAGLQAIPNEFYDAAKIDGAGAWKSFRHITIPLLNPALTSAVVFAVIWSFLIFTEPYIITGGGPSHATETFLLQIYYRTWITGKAGYGTALTIVSAFLGLFMMVIMRRLVERRVEL